MASARRTHHIELFSGSGLPVARLELKVVGAMVYDGHDVHCDEVEEIALQVHMPATWSHPNPTPLSVDLDTVGNDLGAALVEYAAKELEMAYADDAQEIAEETAERTEAVYEEGERSWHKDYGRSR